MISPLVTDEQVQGAVHQLFEVTRGLAYSFPTDSRADASGNDIYEMVKDFNSGVSCGRGKGVREAQSYLAISRLHTALDGARTRGGETTPYPRSQYPSRLRI